MDEQMSCPHCGERKKKRTAEEQKALLTRLHTWLTTKFGHHLPDDTAQHASAHGSCHWVHTRLAIVLLLRIARLTILLCGDCGLLSRVNDVLE